jgi:capsid protein
MVQYLRQGEEMQAFTPAANSAIEPVSRLALMGIAVGSGVTYHQLTGDLSQANYSSLKAGLTDQRKFVSDLQWHMLAPQVITRVIKLWVQLAILSGRLRPRKEGYPCQVIMPAFEPVDPKKDLEADILAVRAGRMSPQDFIGAWGRDWRTVIAEYTEFLAAADHADLVFDIDARLRTRTGQQITEPSAEAPSRGGERMSRRSVAPAVTPDGFLPGSTLDRRAGGDVGVRFMPASYNADSRTVTAVASSGARVRRWGIFEELARLG